MRQLLCAGLAVLAVFGGSVAADPATPQLSPLHRQREDALRLREQQRDLDRPRPQAPSSPSSPSPSPSPPSSPSSPSSGPAAPVPSGGTRHTTRNAGLVLLGVAGLSAIVALPLETFNSGSPDGGDSTTGSVSTLLLVTAAITATGGLVLVLSDRVVSVAPTVTARGVGVSLVGRL
jgi:hypothetical protein